MSRLSTFLRKMRRVDLDTVQRTVDLDAVEIDALRNALRRRLMTSTIDPVRNSGAPPSQGPGVQVNNYVVAKFIVDELNYIVGHWPYPPPELYLMVCAVCWIKPQLIIEWGTNVGNSARVFWTAATKFDIPCQIHSVDLPEDVSHSENIKMDRGVLVRGLPRVKLHIGDGLDIAMKIFREQPSGTRSLFFLDGDHSYQSVMRELEGISCIAPDAAMLIHDTHPSWGNDGPHHAVQNFQRSNPGKYEAVRTELGLPGMTFMYPASHSLANRGR